jgi:hypothetical protein
MVNLHVPPEDVATILYDYAGYLQHKDTHQNNDWKLESSLHPAQWAFSPDMGFLLQWIGHIF